MTESGEDLVLRAIRHGAVAGGLVMLSRADERVRRGLARAAEHHSALAGRMLTEWARMQGVGAPSSIAR